MLTGKFHDAHPVFHTLSNWLVTRLWLSPACVAAAQIAALSAVIGCGISSMRRAGMPRWLGVATAFVLAVLPANGTMVITLWKDVPYSIALLLLALLTLKIVLSEGAWMERPWAWLVLGLTATLVSLYRHNGLPVALATLALLTAVFPGERRRLAQALGLCAALCFGVRGPLYERLDVVPAYPFFKFIPVLQQTASHTIRGTPITADEQAFLNRLYPLKNGRWPYDPYDVVPLMVNTTFDHSLLVKEKWRLLQLWLALTWRNPSAGLAYLQESSQVVWSIRSPKGVPYFCSALSIRGREVYRMDSRRDERPVEEWKLDTLKVRRPIPPGLLLASSRDWSWLLWRPALPLYLFLFGVFVGTMRSGNWRYLCVAAPVVLQSLVLAAFCPSPEFRYQWSVYLSGLLLGGFLLSGIRPRASAGLSKSGPQEGASSKCDQEKKELAIAYTGTDNLEVMVQARHYNDFLVRQVLRHAGGARTAIDFGAGIGHFSKALRNRGLEVICIEPDAGLGRLLREDGFQCHASIEQCPPASLDYVFTLNVLEHIENDLETLRSLFSRLKPGGTLYVYVPAFPLLFTSMDRKVDHYRRYRLAPLTTLLAIAGFEIRHARYVDSIGFAVTLLYALLGSRRGDLNQKALWFYDRILFPASRLLDLFLGGICGKNLAIVAVRPANSLAQPRLVKVA
jgi:SAM-dependent methyltransferase